jgi:hypothetical protein
MSLLDLALRARIRRDYSAMGMEELLAQLDLLHDFAAAGRLDEATDLNRAELQGWLRELIFVARETLREIEQHEYVGNVRRSGA